MVSRKKFRSNTKTRQRENFLVLMENYNTALEYTSVAANSSGTALEKMANYENSIEAKTKKLTATFEELSANMLNSDTTKGVLDFGTGFVSVLNGIIGKLGIAKTILISIAAIKIADGIGRHFQCFNLEICPLY